MSGTLKDYAQTGDPAPEPRTTERTPEAIRTSKNERWEVLLHWLLFVAGLGAILGLGYLL